jgi:hypothetical protein
MYKILLSLVIFLFFVHDADAQNLLAPVYPVQTTVVYQQFVPYYLIPQPVVPVVPIIYQPTIFVHRRIFCEKRYIIYQPVVNYQYYPIFQIR